MWPKKKVKETPKPSYLSAEDIREKLEGLEVELSEGIKEFVEQDLKSVTFVNNKGNMVIGDNNHIDL